MVGQSDGEQHEKERGICLTRRDECRAARHEKILDAVHGEVAIDDAVIGVGGHPRRTNLMKTTARARPHRRGEVVMEVFDPPAAGFAEIVVPVTMGVDDTVDVVVRETNVDAKFRHAEFVSLIAQGDSALRVRSVFPVVLEWIDVVGVVDEKSGTTPSREKALNAEAEHEANRDDRLAHDVHQMF